MKERRGSRAASRASRSESSRVIAMEADAPLGWISWRLKQGQELAINIAERCVVLKQCLVDLGEARQYCGIGGNVLTKADESTHNEDAHASRMVAAQDVRSH